MQIFNFYSSAARPLLASARLDLDQGMINLQTARESVLKCVRMMQAAVTICLQLGLGKAYQRVSSDLPRYFRSCTAVLRPARFVENRKGKKEGVPRAKEKRYVLRDDIVC